MYCFSSFFTYSYIVKPSSNGTNTESDDDDDGDGSNTGLIVGLILGILALFILIGIVVWYIKKQKKAYSIQSDETVQMSEKK